MSTLDQQQEQYAAIELLYSEQKWAEVLAASESLLASLAPESGNPLKPRLLLVMAHTLLYGPRQYAAAAERYAEALQDATEPLLRQIAEQGLGRCRSLSETEAHSGELETPLPPELPQLSSTSPASTQAGGDGEAATPWLHKAAPVADASRSSARDTLAALRAPSEELIPVSVRVMDAVERPAQPIRSAPPRTMPEDLPHSERDLADLARGLLEVELH